MSAHTSQTQRIRNLEGVMHTAVNDLRNWDDQLKFQGTGERNSNAERLMVIAGNLERELNRSQ